MSPTTATNLGVPGSDHLWDDLSPDGVAAKADLLRRYRQRIVPHLGHPDPDQRHAAEVLLGFIDIHLDGYDSGDYLEDLSHIACSFNEMRLTFDIMPRDTASAWENIAGRMANFGEALDGWRSLLAEGRDQGRMVARRQVESVIRQAERLAGESSLFVTLTEEAEAAGFGSEAAAFAAASARAAAADTVKWLQTEYLPYADEEDGVGQERYLRAAERFLGMVIDPHETYRWGWSEVDRLRREMTRVAADIDPSSSVGEVIELLETSAEWSVDRGEFPDFVLARLQRAVADLDGAHFDVPDPIKPITVSLAPPGGPLGAWYVSPSADWQRPGSVWYALGERQQIPVWQEVSTAYHEGFPGHHLQSGVSMFQADRLSRAHRLLIWYSGYGEGWALYAERLMDELGYFEVPEYRLGMLASQLFRAIRVVVDIGCHLGLAIPPDAPLHPGETWSYPIGVEYIQHLAYQPADVSRSEVKRYLGWPGQAISYKVGEREILDIRERLRERGDFDLKDFHRRVLERGEVRLDHLRRLMLDD